PLSAVDQETQLRQDAQKTWDAYACEAERCTDTNRWKRLMETGVEAAVRTWETEAIQLAHEGWSPTETSGQIRQDLEQQVDLAYGKKLAEDWSIEKRGQYLDHATVLLNPHLKALLFQTDALGQVLCDANGNPIKNTSASHEDFQTALESLHARALEGWSQGDLARTAELAALSPQALQAFRTEKQSRLAAFQQEWAAMADREQARFMNLKNSDQASLRAKSEGLAADSLTAQLVAQVSAGTVRGMENLHSGLQAVTGAKPQDIDNLAKNWQADFQKQINEGLTQWHQAEQTLLQSRMDWENRSDQDMKNGQTAWQNAYIKLEQSRQDWEGQMQSLISQAGQQWDSKQSQLQTAITEAQAQWQEALRDRKDLLSDQIGAEVDLVSQDAQLIKTAKQAANSWLSSSFWRTEGAPVQLGSSQMWNLVGEKFEDLLRSKWEFSSREAESQWNASRSRLAQIETSLKIYANLSQDNLNKTAVFETYQDPANFTSYVFNTWELPVFNGGYSGPPALRIDDSKSIGALVRRRYALTEALSDPESFHPELPSSQSGYETGVTLGGRTYSHPTPDEIKQLSALYKEELLTQYRKELPTLNQKLIVYDQYAEKLLREQAENHTKISELYQSLLVNLAGSSMAQAVIHELLVPMMTSLMDSGSRDPIGEALGQLSKTETFDRRSIDLSALLESSGLNVELKSALSVVGQENLTAILQMAKKSALEDELKKFSGEFLLDQGAGELSYWSVIQKNYQASLEEHEQLLVNTYGVTLDDGSSSTFTGDLSREVMKAETVKSYWDKQLEIAKAVRDYAINPTSTRETDASTQQKLNDAYNLYDAKKTAYDQAVIRLQKTQNSLDMHLGLLGQKRLELSKLSQDVQTAQASYQALIDQVTAKNGNFFIRQFQSTLNQLEIQRGISVAGSPTSPIEPAELDYQAAWNTFLVQDAQARSAARLALLVDGKPAELPEPKYDSLDQLKKNRDSSLQVDDALNWGEGTQPEQEMIKLGIAQDHPEYARGLQIYETWHTATGPQEKSIALSRLELWIKQKQNQTRAAYENRVEQIHLLTGTDLVTWYAQVSHQDTTGWNGARVAEDLQSKAFNSEWFLRQQMAQREVSVWSEVKRRLESFSSSPSLNLAAWSAESLASNLAQIWIAQNLADSANNREVLTKQAEGYLNAARELEGCFLNPGDWAKVQEFQNLNEYGARILKEDSALGKDWNLLEFEDLKQTALNTRNLAQNWSECSASCPALLEASRTRSLEDLNETLSNSGLLDRQPEAILQGLQTKEDAVDWASRILAQASGSGTGLPEYLQTSLDDELCAIVKMADLTLAWKEGVASDGKALAQSQKDRAMMALQDAQGRLIASSNAQTQQAFIGQRTLVHFWDVVLNQENQSDAQVQNWRTYVAKAWVATPGEGLIPVNIVPVDGADWRTWNDEAGKIKGIKNNLENWKIDTYNEILKTSNNLKEALNSTSKGLRELSAANWNKIWTALPAEELSSADFHPYDGGNLWDEFSSSAAEQNLMDARQKVQSLNGLEMSLEKTLCSLGENYETYVSLQNGFDKSAEVKAQGKVTTAEAALADAVNQYNSQLSAVQSANDSLISENTSVTTALQELETARAQIQKNQAVRDYAVGTSMALQDANNQYATVLSKEQRAKEVVQILKKLESDGQLFGIFHNDSYNSAWNDWTAKVGQTCEVSRVEDYLEQAQSNQQKAVNDQWTNLQDLQDSWIKAPPGLSSLNGPALYLEYQNSQWAIAEKPSSEAETTARVKALQAYFQDNQGSESQFETDLAQASNWLFSQGERAKEILQQWGLAMAYQAEKMPGDSGLNGWANPATLRPSATRRLDANAIRNLVDLTNMQAHSAYVSVMGTTGEAKAAFELFQAMAFLGSIQNSGDSNVATGVFGGAWNSRFLENARAKLKGDEVYQLYCYNRRTLWDLGQKDADWRDYNMAKAGREDTEQEENSWNRILEGDVANFLTKSGAFTQNWKIYQNLKSTQAEWNGCAVASKDAQGNVLLTHTASVDSIIRAVDSIVTRQGTTWQILIGADKNAVIKNLKALWTQAGAGGSADNLSAVKSLLSSASDNSSEASSRLKAVGTILQTTQGESLEQSEIQVAEFVQSGEPANLQALYVQALGGGWNQIAADRQRVDYLLSQAQDEDSEQTRSLLLRDAGIWMQNLYSDRMNSALQVQSDTWNSAVQDLVRQRSDWQTQMNGLLTQGRKEWQAAEKKFQDARGVWFNQFSQQYQVKDTVWISAYQNLETAWVNKAGQTVSQKGGAEMMEQLGLDQGEAIRLSQVIAIDPLNSFSNAQDTIRRLSVSPTLAEMLKELQARGKTLNSLGAEIAGKLGLGGLGNSYVSAKIFAAQTQDTEQIQKHLARVALEVARQNLEKASQTFQKQVGRANQNTRSGISQTLASAGYQQQGGVWDRTAVIDSTINGEIREHQKVDDYVDYTMPALDVQFDFSGLDHAGASSLGALAEVSSELAQLQNDLTNILGDGKENKGAFGVWVGEAPSQDSSGSGQMGHIFGQYQANMTTEAQGLAALAKPGYDQKLWDDRNSSFKAPNIQSLSQMGVSLLATLITAPLGGIGGALLAAGINIASSAAWTGAEIVNGVENASDGWGSWAKGALTSVATAVVGSVFGGVVKAPTNFILGANVGQNFMDAGLNGLVNTGNSLGDLALKTGLSGAHSATDQLISSSVNSLTFSSNGIGFDRNQFQNSWSNSAGYAEIASSMAQTFTSGAMNNTGRGFLGDSWSNYQKLGNFGGSLVGSGVSYAMSGSAMLNVANLADISALSDLLGFHGLDALGSTSGSGTGLLEMHLGDNGFGMKIGSGGADVSGSALYSASQGLGVWAQNAQIDAQAQKLMQGPNGITQDLSTALRSIGSGVDAKSTELYNSIMSGTTTLKDNPALNAAAQTIIAGDGTKTIQLGRGKAGKENGEFDMSVLLAHEAMRNGEWDGTSGQQNETTQAVLNHIRMAQDILATYGGGLSSNLAGEAELLGNAQSVMSDQKLTSEDKQKALAALGKDITGYDFSKDYWKLLNDGTLQYDGQGYLTDEQGLYINQDGSKSRNFGKSNTIGAGGVESGLLNILNGGTGGVGYDNFSDEQVAQAQQLMSDSGLTHSGDGRQADWTLSANAEVKLNTSLMASYASSMASPVFIKQYSGLIFNSSLPSSYLAYILPAYPGVGTRINQMREQLASAQRTLTDHNGGTTTFYLPSKDSPVNSMLVNQHDFPEPMNSSACAMLTMLATASQVAGVAMPYDDISNFAASLASDVYDPLNVKVLDRDAYMNAALDWMGRSDLGLWTPTRKYPNPPAGAVEVAVFQQKQYESESHYVEDGLDGTLIYNPGFTNGANQGATHVYVYKRH
ncbi:MAG: hypothetical protein HKM06_08205, partial [Spirochaetales bacterium]|nr:hypothetical protein [Spirochaetales bacterium]